MNIATALAARGKKVHLTTTDPAAHVAQTLGTTIATNLQVSRIDPIAETAAYSQDVLATAGANLDAVILGSHGKSNLKEMILGSVSENVIRNSHRPVIVIKR